MPSEVRTLIFDPEELREVVVDYCLRKGRTLPNTRVQSVHVDEDSKDFLTAEFEPEDIKKGTGKRTMSFTREQVAAALIMYCRARRIPLPRFGKKTLSSDNNAVTLTISVGVPETPAPATE